VSDRSEMQPLGQGAAPTLRTLSKAVNVGRIRGMTELRFVWPLLA
jgi:hypothetical protein